MFVYLAMVLLYGSFVAACIDIIVLKSFYRD